MPAPVGFARSEGDEYHDFLQFALASGKCGKKENEREAGHRRLLASTCFFVNRTRTPPGLEEDPYGVHPGTDRRGAVAVGKRSIKSDFHCSKTQRRVEYLKRRRSASRKKATRPKTLTIGAVVDEDTRARGGREKGRMLDERRSDEQGR